VTKDIAPYNSKRKPTYLLKDIKELIKKDKIIFPNKEVISDVNNLCLTMHEAYEEILKLEPKDFSKSSTQPSNNKIWQDAYKKVIKGFHIYIKFKTFDGKFLLTSFKLDENKRG